MPCCPPVASVSRWPASSHAEASGAEVATDVAEKKRPNGNGLADVYRLARLSNSPSGKHRATVTIREIATKRTSEKKIEFST